jgi:hypothetical protein
VEIGLNWRRSTRCDNGSCVEIALLATGAAMRDSKDPEGGMLVFSSSAWTDFILAVRSGEFDNL